MDLGQTSGVTFWEWQWLFDKKLGKIHDEWEHVKL